MTKGRIKGTEEQPPSRFARLAGFAAAMYQASVGATNQRDMIDIVALAKKRDTTPAAVLRRESRSPWVNRIQEDITAPRINTRSHNSYGKKQRAQKRQRRARAA